MKIVILPGLDGTGRLLTEFARELGEARLSVRFRQNF